QFTNTGSSDDGVFVSADNNGNAVAVYNLDSNTIQASYNVAGIWGAPVIISSTPPTNNRQPSVDMNASGLAIAVWTPDEVHSAQFISGVWSIPTPDPIDLTGGIFDRPGISVNNSGNALAAWASGTDVNASFYSAGTWSPFVSIGPMGFEP